jgi:hypothetical protein
MLIGKLSNMKLIKLSGRELAALRSIPNEGSTGAEIIERTHIAPQELVDVLNGLTDAGFVEPYAPGSQVPYLDTVPISELLRTRFEINPSYVFEIRKATARS